jgi:polysaccharide deacetylase family protein (PEP-CTERM system associated)
VAVVVNAFTVDVEDWFHICGVPALREVSAWDALPSRVVATTDLVLRLLDRAGVTATCFVLGWVAERHPEVVARIRRAGHEIGSHGYAHRRVYELGDEAFEADVREASAALVAAGAEEPRLFRAPEWSINDRAPWALDRLASLGFDVDSSRAPMSIVGNPGYPQHPHALETTAGRLLEAPPFVTRRFGQLMPFGGGWGLRMSRPGRTLAEIERRNAEGMPVTLWLHPWELDPDPPRIRLPLATSFAHYFRLDGLAGRLEEVLRGASFGTIGEMLASVGLTRPAPVSLEADRARS